MTLFQWTARARLLSLFRHPLRFNGRCVVAACLVAIGCRDASHDTHGAMDAASGVERADSGLGARAPRIIPLSPIAGDVQLLLGNPDSAGPFVMRINELAGTIVPPHSHPVDEHITVVHGTWWFGLGDHYDSTALRPLGTGGYAFAPAGSTMFAASPEPAIVQISGNGPFHIHWRDGLATLDSAGSVVFRFRRGDTVRTPRGPAVVREGYASGAIIQYDLQSPGGTHFMASENSIKRER